MMIITRPVEPLIGTNLGVIRQRLGNVHCMTNIREQLRIARPNKMRSLPPKLRRGWVLSVLETIAEYRTTYAGVMSGNLDYSAELRR